MKKSSTLLVTLCGSGILLGCASNSPDGKSGMPKLTLQPVVEMAQALYNRGRELHRKSQLDEAEKNYERALALDPFHLESKNAMAALSARRGDVDHAIRILVILSESHPDKPHVFANLGYAYFLKGQHLQAQEALERAVTLDPENQNAWSKLGMVMIEMKRAEMAARPVTPTQVAQERKPAEPEVVAEINVVMPGVYELRHRGAEKLVPESVSAPAGAASRSRTSGRVELVNGNGVTGMARGLRSLIAGDQWKVVRTSNHEQFSVRKTRIEYSEKYYPAARELADRLGVKVKLMPNYHQSGSNLRIVLGHDFKSLQPLLQKVAGDLAQPAL